MPETPRTDAAYEASRPRGDKATAWDFARTLERENAKLREALKHLCNVVYFDINGALPISVSKALNAAVSALDDTAQ